MSNILQFHMMSARSGVFPVFNGLRESPDGIAGGEDEAVFEERIRSIGVFVAHGHVAQEEIAVRGKVEVRAEQGHAHGLLHLGPAAVGDDHVDLGELAAFMI